MPDWKELFALSAPALETFIRGSAMYLGIFAMMRIVGKREGGSHALTDLLVIVLIAEAASHGMAGEARGISASLVLIATILFWSVALDALAWRFKPLGRLLKPGPSPLVRDGKLDRRALRRELMTQEELMAELRLHGITDLSEVARAYLENNGMVSVLRRDGKEADAPTKPPALG